MIVVHKYEIKEKGYSEIEMPENAIVRDAMAIGMKLYIWVETDPERDKLLKSRTFFLCMTGGGYDHKRFNTHRHIRTVRFANGIVLHLFEALYPVENE